MNKIRFIGLDVHANTIAVAIAEPNGEVRSIGMILNREASIRRCIKKLGSPEELRACYEAGPTGYVLYWQLTRLGVHCDVIAPSLIPRMPGDKVKTDRRDAVKLARCYRAGDLTPCWVPDATHEALRDLIRAREAAKRDQQRTRRRLATFLLRHGWRRPDDLKTAWSTHHMKWIKSAVHFELPALEATLIDYVHEVEHMALRIKRLNEAISEAIAAAPARLRAVIEALQALRGIAEIGAATIASEIGDMSRFRGAKQLMGYSGLVPSEYSSGRHRYQGSITKTGNAHLRRVLVEASWAYQFRPWLGGWLLKRQANVSPEVKEIAWKAQHRLHARYRTLLTMGKNKPKIVTAIGRELLGFVWDIGVITEAEYDRTNKVAA
ncbi:MAG TPA: IS110 family transposase [Candidatus Dormibacteraeota bacterium]|nr:IS110 family transposase [Candidatus Dormibacteraeota bacterium]